MRILTKEITPLFTGGPYSPTHIFTDPHGRRWDYTDESTHVIVDGQRFAKCQRTGELSGPLVQDEHGRWCWDGRLGLDIRLP